MRLIYLREAPGLPTIKAQKIALGLDKVADDDPVYIDLNPKRRRATPGEPFPELALAIRALRKGENDELAVAIPAILGGSRSQVLEVMQAVGARHAAVFNAATDRAIPWNPQALAVLDFAGEAETFTRSASLRKARVRRAELGRGNGVVPKLTGKAKEAALKIWLDPERTGNQAAAEIGVSPSTAYRKLGPRDQDCSRVVSFVEVASPAASGPSPGTGCNTDPAYF